VEAEIDAMIRRRDTPRRETEGERRERELWAESEAHHAQQRREANRSAWREYPAPQQNGPGGRWKGWWRSMSPPQKD
jgi:hypothetical protein